MPGAQQPQAYGNDGIVTGRECLGGEVPQGVYYLQFEEMGLEEKHAMRAAS